MNFRSEVRFGGVYAELLHRYDFISPSDKGGKKCLGFGVFWWVLFVWLVFFEGEK